MNADHHAAIRRTAVVALAAGLVVAAAAAPAAPARTPGPTTRPAASPTTRPAGAPTTRPAGPQCYALLVGGMPGTPIHARRYADWLRRMHAYLTGPAKVWPGNVVVLSGDPKLKDDPIVNAAATAEALEKALADLAKRVRPEDQFVLFIVGHGGMRMTVPTFVLPGPDLAADRAAALLENIPSRNEVILHFGNLGGKWVEHLAAANRVIVTGTEPRESAEPVYAEFFLRGLESERADGEGDPKAGKKDGVITLLEAYNWAAYQTALWIARIRAVELKQISETLMIVVEEKGWNVEGRESVEIFKKLCVAEPGTPGSRVLGAGSKPDIDDPIVPLRASEKYDDSLSNRRMITEHAALEDCGEKIPVSALSSTVAKDKDYQPLAGDKDGEPGHRARRVVLGRAELIGDER
jgi:hypothetical protein